MEGKDLRPPRPSLNCIPQLPGHQSTSWRPNSAPSYVQSSQGGGSVYPGAQLGPRSLEVVAGGCFARQNHHSQILAPSFMGAQHPPTAQSPGSSWDLKLHHLSPW